MCVCIYIYLHYICMYVYVERERERKILIPHTCKMKGAILKYSPAVEIDKLFSSPINL